MQEIREHRIRPTATGKTSKFAGLLYCADCGAKLHYCAAKSMTAEQECYRCSNYKSGRGTCKIHYIRNVVLEKIVLEACEKEREYAKQYFEKKGVLDSKVLYFDCGWNGSSQYLLKRFYRALGKKKEVPFVYVGIMDTEKSRKQLNGLPYFTYCLE